jgi:carbamoyl-phosphate synthase large subunit
MRKVAVGVTGTGSLIGQAIIKSLNNSSFSDEINVIGFDYVPGTIGSHWVEKNFLLPDFLKEEITDRMWFEKIVGIIKKEKIKILLIGIDFELPIFAKYKKDIESQTQCKVVVSDLDIVEIADDKYLTYQFLKDGGFAHPKTVMSTDLAKSEIRFPCVIKPRRGAGSKGVYLVESREELTQRLPRGIDYIVQELIGNPEEEYTCGVLFFDDAVKEMIVLKRQLKDGVTVTANYRKDFKPVISRYVHDITVALKPFGPCNFQLRIGSDDVPKVFEINARHSGTTYMRSLFGFKEVEYVFAYLLGRKVKKFILREGVVKRYYEEKFVEA